MHGKDKANHPLPLIQLNKSVVNNVSILQITQCFSRRVFFFFFLRGGGWGRKVDFLYCAEICIKKESY